MNAAIRVRGISGFPFSRLRRQAVDASVLAGTFMWVSPLADTGTRIKLDELSRAGHAHRGTGARLQLVWGDLKQFFGLQPLGLGGLA
jgi:hypothetical protein